MSLVKFTPGSMGSMGLMRPHCQPSTIAIGKIKPLIKMLVAEGVRLSDLLHSTGIPFSELAKYDTTIQLEQYFQLINNAYCLAPDPTFALRLGEQLYINHDGILACRVMSCANASQAMRLLAEYQSLLTHLFYLDFTETADYGVFSAEPAYPLDLCLPFFIEYTFASIYSLGKFCTGSAHIALAYEFSYDCRASDKRYTNFFGAKVAFGCEQNRVIIPKSILKKPFIFENQQTAQLNDKICQDKVRRAHLESSVIEQVKSLLAKSNLAEVSLEIIAERLYMTPRTLRRHLKTDNISYKALLEDERKRAVQKALTQNMPLKKITQQLGYKDTSSFSRAFKQWFGMPPHLYKEMPPQPDELP